MVQLPVTTSCLTLSGHHPLATPADAASCLASRIVE